MAEQSREAVVPLRAAAIKFFSEPYAPARGTATGKSGTQCTAKKKKRKEKKPENIIIKCGIGGIYTRSCMKERV